jgi:hypothetical protein
LLDLDAIRLAKELDGLPLALATARAYLDQVMISLSFTLLWPSFYIGWCLISDRVVLRCLNILELLFSLDKFATLTA